jgi:hypothetical protein
LNVVCAYSQSSLPTFCCQQIPSVEMLRFDIYETTQ